MKELTEVKVLKIAYQSSLKSYFILLNELKGEKVISFPIGSFEAQTIALALDSNAQARLMTHDLICSLFYETGFILKGVQITDFKNGVLYSSLDLELRKVERLRIEARPSDAITIALKENAPILVSKKLIENSNLQTITLSKLNNEKQEDFYLKTLKSKLKNAVKSERYRVAAKLRDKIKEIEG